MAGRLAGKTCLVTGAAQGIGRAVAVAFAAEGARVFATDLNLAPLEELAREAGVMPLRLDVSDDASIASVMSALGRVDVLCTCAAIVHHGTILDCDGASWDRLFDVNVKGVYRVVRAVLPGMLTAGSGSIINLASIVSSVRAAPNRAAYAATKGAIVALSKAVAVDFMTRGIRCNVICPATIDTPSLRQRIAASADPIRAEREFIARQPLGRLGRAEEVAALAIHLASDESAFTTGAVHVIDGGWDA